MKRLLILLCMLFSMPVTAQNITSVNVTLQDAAVQTITVANTSQVALTTNTARRYLFCQNSLSATETLYLKIGDVAGAANNSYELAPGGSLNFAFGGIPSGAVNVSAATVGHRFTCTQGFPNR